MYFTLIIVLYVQGQAHMCKFLSGGFGTTRPSLSLPVDRSVGLKPGWAPGLDMCPGLPEVLPGSLMLRWTDRDTDTTPPPTSLHAVRQDTATYSIIHATEATVKTQAKAYYHCNKCFISTLIWKRDHRLLTFTTL